MCMCMHVHDLESYIYIYNMKDITIYVYNCNGILLREFSEAELKRFSIRNDNGYDINQMNVTMHG